MLDFCFTPGHIKKTKNKKQEQNREPKASFQCCSKYEVVENTINCIAPMRMCCWTATNANKTSGIVQEGLRFCKRWPCSTYISTD